MYLEIIPKEEKSTMQSKGINLAIGSDPWYGSEIFKWKITKNIFATFVNITSDSTKRNLEYP